MVKLTKEMKLILVISIMPFFLLTKTKKRINPMNDELKINEYLTKTFNTERKTIR